MGLSEPRGIEPTPIVRGETDWDGVAYHSRRPTRCVKQKKQIECSKIREELVEAPWHLSVYLIKHGETDSHGIPAL